MHLFPEALVDSFLSSILDKLCSANTFELQRYATSYPLVHLLLKCLSYLLHDTKVYDGALKMDYIQHHSLIHGDIAGCNRIILTKEKLWLAI